MCATCGCSDAAGVGIVDASGTVHRRPHPRGHDHEGGHGLDHGHGHGTETRTVSLEQAVLARNEGFAASNRAWLAERGVLAVNLMSSPGAGKTTLLERTIRDVGAQLAIAVVEGDQETVLDGERIRAAGAVAAQINTGAGCHLDAVMLADALRTIDPRDGSVVLVENVGNLVCPALFDLGEGARVVIASVAEGDEKPLKYPHMFRVADLVLLNKMDLLPYVEFDVAAFTGGARRANPRVEVLPVSATRGDGLDEWYAWLREGGRRADPR